MGSLFAELARRASTNARREVETYTREIQEFGFLDKDARARAQTLEHAMWFRCRTVELSPGNDELSGADLEYIASMGELRARAGVSLDGRQRVLRVHTELMLREINEATEAQRGGGVDELMRMMAWFAPQGERGISAYRQGFVRVLRRRISYTEQVALLVRSLLNGDLISAELAEIIDMELSDRYAVTVFRFPDRPVVDRFLESEIGELVKSHRAPVMWGPEGGDGSGELVALLPLFSGTAASQDVPPHLVSDLLPDLVPDHLPDLVRDFAHAVGRPCAVGTATAPLAELPEALERARRISRVAAPSQVTALLRPHTLADVFVELAVGDVPFIDDWLRVVARRLAPGPDLLATLDAYYRHDMHRGAAATALNVHPRTLDYRLRRVRELTGVDPGSTRGVRTLSAVVARELSGAWR
ncbi:helix-turn-helix domain-containing protein [Streptomyces sp. SID13726]|uniref:PucR family transcriptional regulator n=1 Tax=Streptomyces sp. SID13726 TaxID=2706058 RepID=UPI0013B903EE|nr:helix-turn-helix domain-containing protein [Streptomyces sp. SID13726]NEB04774.1 PucR family transcriptional regulator [Streptomyces sp. SID13726]